MPTGALTAALPAKPLTNPAPRGLLDVAMTDCTVPVVGLYTRTLLFVVSLMKIVPSGPAAMPCGSEKRAIVPVPSAAFWTSGNPATSRAVQPGAATGGAGSAVGVALGAAAVSKLAGQTSVERQLVVAMTSVVGPVKTNWKKVLDGALPVSEPAPAMVRTASVAVSSVRSELVVAMRSMRPSGAKRRAIGYVPPAPLRPKELDVPMPSKGTVPPPTCPLAAPFMPAMVVTETSPLGRKTARRITYVW